MTKLTRMIRGVELNRTVSADTVVHRQIGSSQFCRPGPRKPDDGSVRLNASAKTGLKDLTKMLISSLRMNLGNNRDWSSIVCFAHSSHRSHVAALEGMLSVPVRDNLQPKLMVGQAESRLVICVRSSNSDHRPPLSTVYPYLGRGGIARLLRCP